MSAVAHIKTYKTGRFFSNEFRGELSWNGYENNVLLRNEGVDADGTPQFTDVALAVGADDGRDARGYAAADFDHDGDLDLVVNHNPGDNDDAARRRPTLYRNDIGHARAWLSVELEGRTSNRDAIGATVAVTTNTVASGDHRQMRLLSAGSGYASQHSGRLHFGLGDAEEVTELVVRWPSGAEERFGPLATRQHLRLVEGEGLTVLPATPTPTLGGADAPARWETGEPESGTEREG